jgi:hypothetical protein
MTGLGSSLGLALSIIQATALIMTAPPINVAKSGVSPGQTHTQSGARTTSVIRSSGMRAAATDRCPRLNSGRPTPKANPPEIKAIVRSRRRSRA